MPVGDGSADSTGPSRAGSGQSSASGWSAPGVIMQGVENSVLAVTLLGSEPPSPELPLGVANDRYVAPTLAVGCVCPCACV